MERYEKICELGEGSQVRKNVKNSTLRFCLKNIILWLYQVRFAQGTQLVFIYWKDTKHESNCQRIKTMWLNYVHELFVSSIKPAVSKHVWCVGRYELFIFCSATNSTQKCVQFF